MGNWLRFLAPLTVLVAAPLVGVGGRAQASLLSPAWLMDRAPAESFGGADAEGASGEMGSAAAGELLQDANPLPGDQPAHLEWPAPPPRGKAIIAVGANGADSQPSTGGGAGGSSHLSIATAGPSADPPALVGALFLETALRRPPPFPSRLFRPPRLSEILV